MKELYKKYIYCFILVLIGMIINTLPVVFFILIPSKLRFLLPIAILFCILFVLYFRKVYRDEKLINAIKLSSVLLGTWHLIVFLFIFIFITKFNEFNFWLSFILGSIFQVIFMLLLILFNIIFIIRTYKKDRNGKLLFLGISIQLAMPTLFVLFFVILIKNPFVSLYSDNELLSVMSRNEKENNLVIVETFDCEVHDNSSEMGCDISLNNYMIPCDKYTYVSQNKKCKIYNIKGEKYNYTVGSFVGSKRLFPSKYYEIIKKENIQYNIYYDVENGY